MTGSYFIRAHVPLVIGEAPQLQSNLSSQDGNK